MMFVNSYHSCYREVLNVELSTTAGQKPSALDLLQEVHYGSVLPRLRFHTSTPTCSTLLHLLHPLTNPFTCTLTYSVLDTTTPQLFLRARSNYLASLRSNDHSWVSVPPGPRAFHFLMPNVAIIIICTGSELPPFLGFVQERAKMMK